MPWRGSKTKCHDNGRQHRNELRRDVVAMASGDSRLKKRKRLHDQQSTPGIVPALSIIFDRTPSPIHSTLSLNKSVSLSRSTLSCNGHRSSLRSLCIQTSGSFTQPLLARSESKSSLGSRDSSLTSLSRVSDASQTFRSTRTSFLHSAIPREVFDFLSHFSSPVPNIQTGFKPKFPQGKQTSSSSI